MKHAAIAVSLIAVLLAACDPKEAVPPAVETQPASAPISAPAAENDGAGLKPAITETAPQGAASVEAPKAGEAK